jgi:transposase
MAVLRCEKKTRVASSSTEAAMAKRYKVTLSDDEQQELLTLIRKGVHRARTLARARILLAAAEGATDRDIAARLQVGIATVERTRKRFVEGGLTWALNEAPRPGAKRKLDGKQEAYLVALACSSPPDGRQRWTLQLLADRLVKLAVVDTISDETVRRTLKKRR